MNGTEETSLPPKKLPLPVVLGRAGMELDRIADLIGLLEESLLPTNQKPSETNAIMARQSVDIIQQSINVLACFLNTAAEQSDCLDIPVEQALAQVSLGAMRERLINGE